MITWRKVFLALLGCSHLSFGELTSHSTTKGRVPPFSPGTCAWDRSPVSTRSFDVAIEQSPIEQSAIEEWELAGLCFPKVDKKAPPTPIPSPRAGGPGLPAMSVSELMLLFSALLLSLLRCLSSIFMGPTPSPGPVSLNITGLGEEAECTQLGIFQKVWPWEGLKTHCQALARTPGTGL